MFANHQFKAKWAPCDRKTNEFQFSQISFAFNKQDGKEPYGHRQGRIVVGRVVNNATMGSNYLERTSERSQASLLSPS